MQGNFLFHLNSRAEKCETIKKSLNRFYQRVFPASLNGCSSMLSSAIHGYLGLLEEVAVDLMGRCELFPTNHMDESYEVVIDEHFKGVIRSNTSWGILRGLESFTHLTYKVKHQSECYILINATHIVDWPRFQYRGLLLDTSRHFIPKADLIRQLDLMEMNKLNVFHWHIVDDQSFPLKLKTFQNLSEFGAFDPISMVYGHSDIEEIIEEARLRGIRVIPEIDIPGHAKSWNAGRPGLLTQCEDNNTRLAIDVFGPIDPIGNTTYDFLSKLFEEVFQIFPDSHVHLGGDEVLLEDNCWRRNGLTKNFIRAETLKDRAFNLQKIFFARLFKELNEKPFSKYFVVWQDAFESVDNLPLNCTVQVWKDWGRVGWLNTMSKAIRNGHTVILSAPWYLNQVNEGADWIEFYNVKELLTDSHYLKSAKFIGCEISIWGEFVNKFNLVSRIWPRASAPSELFWTGRNDSIVSVLKRLQEHECRMMERGFGVSPAVGPGFCLVESMSQNHYTTIATKFNKSSNDFLSYCMVASLLLNILLMKRSKLMFKLIK